MLIKYFNEVNMKKIVSALIIVVFILILSGCADDPEGKVRVANANLYADEYIDYANDVYLDTDTYPDLEEMGLFWTYWDEDEEKVVQVAADSAEGAELVDPDKPTMINVHGMLGNGHVKQEAFNLNDKVANPEEFDLETDNVPMNYVWMKEGWNVGNFHYNRFASEMSPTNIEYKIWTDGGDVGLRSRHSDGKYSHVTEYSIAEHFAAEYIRAMNLLPDTMGEKEIRVAAHSMGGEVATAGIFLLTELADFNQISFDKLPDRYALLDAYFSTTITMNDKSYYIGPQDTNIKWSDKPLVDNNVGVTMIECLKDMHANGIALEYYTFDASTLLVGVSFVKDEMLKLMPFVTVNPRFQGSGYSYQTDGHNGVREWYLMSILAPPVEDKTDQDIDDNYAPSASLPTEELKELINNEYQLVEGSRTVNALDDEMIRI